MTLSHPALTPTDSIPTDSVPPGSIPSAVRRPQFPVPAQVLLMRQWHPTVAHGVRLHRRGHQTLISIGGRLTWVPSARVALSASPDGVEARPPSGR